MGKDEFCQFVVSDFDGLPVICGKKGVAKVDFAGSEARYGVMTYCKRHWEKVKPLVADPESKIAVFA